MVDITAALTTGLLLSMVANRLVEGLVVPLYEHFKWDKFSVLYVSWLVGAVIVGLGQVNLFVAYIPNQLAGLILTALVAGGGANLLNSIFGSLDAFKTKKA